MSQKMILLLACIAAGAVSSPAAAVDPAQMKACLLPHAPAEGIAACDRLLAAGGLTGPEIVQASGARAFSLYLSGRSTDAVAALDGLTRRFPGSGQAEAHRAMLLHKLRRWPEAEASARRAISLDRTLPVPHVVLALALDQRGESNAALPIHARAAALAPNLPLAQNTYCWALTVANRDLDKALAACNRAVSLEPSATHLDSRGLVHYRRGSYVAAIADYDAALASERHAYSLYGRGLSRLALGQAPAGRADLDAAERLNPSVAGRFARWGLTPAAATAAAAAPAAPVAAQGAPSAEAAAARAARARFQAERRFVRERARTESMDRKYQQLTDDESVSDATVDAYERRLWSQQQLLAQARADLEALGVDPDTVR